MSCLESYDLSFDWLLNEQSLGLHPALPWGICCSGAPRSWLQSSVVCSSIPGCIMSQTVLVKRRRSVVGAGPRVDRRAIFCNCVLRHQPDHGVERARGSPPVRGVRPPACCTRKRAMEGVQGLFSVEGGVWFCAFQCAGTLFWVTPCFHPITLNPSPNKCSDFPITKSDMLSDLTMNLHPQRYQN